MVALGSTLAVLSLGGHASATVSEALSLRELVQQADYVVLATAREGRARRDAHGRIVTEYALRVDDVMKGELHAGSRLVMISLGGVLGDLGMRVEGEPHLEAGARYVLFLRRSGDALRPVGMSQGVLPLRGVAEQVVLPGAAGLSLVQRVQGGALLPAPAALLHPEPYAHFRARVDAVVREGPAGAVRP